jgi:DNA mismatch repair ATPase MutS
MTVGVDVDKFKRPLKETMIEMETHIREEYGVDAVMIQKGFFYEAYLESAIYLNRVMGYNTAKGLHDQLMTGVPAGGLKTCIETIEGQGGRIAVVEQIEKTSRKMRRELRYVTGDGELNINNLVIEYQP